MSGFTENRAFETSEQAGAGGRMLTWHVGCAMLKLVGRVVRDVVVYHDRLRKLRPELAQLERNRRNLDWPRRCRRYQLEEDIAEADQEYRSLLAELEVIGIALLDPSRGLVGFPTIVNQRRAYFTWMPDEPTLCFWSYVGDPQRRPVPSEWTELAPEPAPRRSRSRKK